MTNKPRGTLYVGVTSDIGRRIGEHREGHVDGFTKRYGLKILVHAEHHDEIEQAIQTLAARLESRTDPSIESRLAGPWRNDAVKMDTRVKPTAVRFKLSRHARACYGHPRTKAQ